jgi:hypothetical protein
MNLDATREREREIRATGQLMAHGWTPRGNWRFRSPKGSVHDLSAADLSQLNRIEREGLFLA